MSIKLGSARVGHRVGGFYVSTPVTGRNAGKQIRVGHQLPLGFYGAQTVTSTNRGGVPITTPTGGTRVVSSAQGLFNLFILLVGIGIAVTVPLVGVPVALLGLGAIIGRHVGPDKKLHRNLYR